MKTKPEIKDYYDYFSEIIEFKNWEDKFDKDYCRFKKSQRINCYIGWCLKFRKIAKIQMQKLIGRIIEILKQQINFVETERIISGHSHYKQGFKL